MKTILISFFVASILFVSCSNTEEGGNAESATVSKDDVSVEIENLKKLNDGLMTVAPSGTYSAAKLLNEAANDFVNKHPNHEKTAPVLELAAKSAEAMGNYEESLNILDKLITEFPSADTPKYLSNKARLLEERFGNTAEAKKVYDQLIAEYPDDQMAKDAKLYIENFLGKSEDEILMMLDSLNQ